jgi:DNA polymerase I-like protein with 3'-5' exonuclease and polymerase domains
MFPTIPNYIEHTKNQVDYLGFVETFFGRRRRFNTKSMDKYALAKAHRQAVNFKVQSTASEIVLGVLCSVSAPLKEMFGAQLLATVHDSIVFQIHKKYISKLKDFVEEYCVLKVQQQYSWLKTKFQWDISVGPSYGEQQSIDAYLAEHPIETRENDDNWIDVEILEDLEESVTS